MTNGVEMHFAARRILQALCRAQHEIDVYRIEGKHNPSRVGFLQDAGLQKRLDIAVYRLDIAAPHGGPPASEGRLSVVLKEAAPKDDIRHDPAQAHWLLTGSIGVAAVSFGLSVLVVVTGVFDPVRVYERYQSLRTWVPPDRLGRASTRIATRPSQAAHTGSVSRSAPAITSRRRWQSVRTGLSISLSTNIHGDID